MAQSGDNAPLRATIAALAAVAALLGFVIWENAASTLRATSDEARSEGGRAAALGVARAVEAAEPPAGPNLDESIVAAERPVAAALYDNRGERIAVAASAGLATLQAAFPATLPSSSLGGPGPVLVSRSSEEHQVLAIRVTGDRTLLIALPSNPPGALGNTLAGYEALTLVVVLAAIAFAMRRLGKSTQSRFEQRHVTAGSSADGPTREADFVVETFQSVIGELQVKGRQLELASLRDRERAERSERFSERVIAQMPTGLVVVDRNGRVTAANASARELFLALPGARTEAVDYVRAFASAPELVRMVGECLRAGTTFARCEIEMRAGAAAEARCLGVSVSPIAPAEAPEAALCLMTDLTEVVELRDRVRAQETMASLGEMAAGLTHELKNSLATIQGFAQLIAGVAPDSASESAEELVREVGQLSRMVTDFLNFARPEEIGRVPLSLGELTEAVVERLESRMVEARIELDLTIPPEADVPQVMGDEMLVGRALLNVAQNAVEALETVEGPRRLSISLSASGDEVIVEIRDNGPGIAAEDIARIFIPFFTTRSRGHGIGLALTQKIVLAHGGRITVDASGRGASFRCVFPSASRSE